MAASPAFGEVIASGADDSPRAAEQEVVRFDFENGDPQGWEVVDGFVDPDASTMGFVRKRQNPDKELGHFSLATDALGRPHGEWIRPWKRWAGILFAYRPGETEHFHLHEIQIDGSNLRQITTGPFDDIEPCYLPDGGIMFASTRCKRYVPCWRVPVFVLHVCQSDGSGLRQISPNKEANIPETETTPR